MSVTSGQGNVIRNDTNTLPFTVFGWADTVAFGRGNIGLVSASPFNLGQLRSALNASNIADSPMTNYSANEAYGIFPTAALGTRSQDDATFGREFVVYLLTLLGVKLNISSDNSMAQVTHDFLPKNEIIRRIQSSHWQAHLETRRETQHALHRLQERGLMIANQAEVQSFLSRFPSQGVYLRALFGEVSRAIGNEAEYSLALYKDHEATDEYLTLYVRQREYADDIIERLDEVSEAVDNTIPKSAGAVLLTTDFQPPRGM